MLASYVTRLGFTLAKSLLDGKSHALDECRLNFRVWPTDIDLYGHVNNGAYLTLMDQGRFHHSVRTGMMRAFLQNGWKPVLGAATVRFRRELLPLQRCELVTRLGSFDEKWFYIEHRIERQGELHATGFVKGVVKSGRETISPRQLLRAVGYDGDCPPPGPELARWLVAQ